jgi:DNA-binding GntR family transcriptional regulator
MASSNSLSSLQPVRQRTLSYEVADRLRDAIRDGSLSLGSRLVERELAEQMGVSRIPVREAIRQLVEEGLVTKVPHHGTFVYSPSDRDLEEIASLRVVLERFVVERVMARWQPEYETRLEQIVAEMEQAAVRGDHRRVAVLDTQFHHVIWEMANHSILQEIVSGLRSRLSRFLYETTIAVPPAELTTHAVGHREMLEVLRSGEVRAAKAYITEHILTAKDRLLAYCEWPRPYADIDGLPEES